jgi:hypothetical protein
MLNNFRSEKYEIASEMRKLAGMIGAGYVSGRSEKLLGKGGVSIRKISNENEDHEKIKQ